MREINANARTVRQLLKDMKYSIDYYQREYQWQSKHATEMVDDLVIKFLEEYDKNHERKKVKHYPHYFLGPIIISKKNGSKFIVDGQQRLTTLTLLLIHLNNLQAGRDKTTNIEDLILSEQYGEKSFNLQIEEHYQCMESLFERREFDATNESRSVRNIIQRYEDIQNAFPNDLCDEALLHFVDWLIDNVHLVEITANSDDDAYAIFETMNDRGLSLSPTDMLKGFLLANIDEDYRAHVNHEWKDRINKLKDRGKDCDSDFFKAWFRSQHSKNIRQRKAHARPEDFDRIGTEFHRWARDARNEIGLDNPSSCLTFIRKDFDFYSDLYIRLIDASNSITDGLEHVGYNAWNGFTLQYMVLLAPILPNDKPEEIDRKLRITARYIDILITWRIWNFRSIAYSTMQYAMFIVMREIRGMDAQELAHTLHKRLRNEEENFDNHGYHHKIGIGLYVHQQNRSAIHRILARLIEFAEKESGNGSSSRFEELARGGKDPYEVEHIWANKYVRHKAEFDHPADFDEQRNRIGALLLLPKSFNSSYGDKKYSTKLKHYFSQNLLAKSLSPKLL